MSSGETVPARPPGLARDVNLLVKPRIVSMVLLAMTVGYVLAAKGSFHWLHYVQTIGATMLVAMGTSLLNQYTERDTDGLMARTRDRPLPAGRRRAGWVLFWGLAVSVVGVALLTWWANALTAGVAVVVLITYNLCYTPLKRITAANTLVGAVAGALPPVLGWAAVAGELGREAFALFLILFMWQPPHVLAIAWMYKDDYTAARMPMLPVVDPSGNSTRRQLVVYTLALIPVSLYPTMIGMAGPLYFYGALLLGLGLTWSMLVMVRAPSFQTARNLLRATVIYQPLLFMLLVIDGLRT
ncbi:MAG: protoheme IX farnesyltransferase [Candidatus Lambdaproteobacteria bacterium]|nr:protoheme IX farnesyltransferase [Candidatus Lambdaproteobacteria bacterium]